MPASTSKGYPYPLTSDAFLPASVDFPALANAIESKSAREVAAVLSAASVLDVGVSGQIRAGRELVAADFTTLLGLSTPVGLWDAGSLTNLGSGGNLTNKGAVPLTAKGLAGTANHAALFAGSTGQGLYISDTGAADPFRFKTGTWGCWFRTAKRATQQDLVTKRNNAAGQYGYALLIGSNGTLQGWVSFDGTAISASLAGTTDVTDDRWHFGVMTFDGSASRIYVDGVLESSATGAGSIFGSSAPFNVGALGADGSTAANEPFFGRVAVPFATPDVLSEDQIRVLMAAKVAHGYAVTPTRSHLAVRRKRRGGPYVVGDFATTPLVLYNFTAAALADAGSLGSNLTNNGAAVSVAGADGQAAGAFHFTAGSTQYLSATDAGLPTAVASARTLHGWFKTSSPSMSLVAYGTAATGVLVYVDSSGFLVFNDNATDMGAGIPVNDGQWHHWAAVWDNSAADGLKRKLYLDGKLVASTASLTSTAVTGLGAGGLRIGRNRDTGVQYFTGDQDGVAITGYAMAEDEVLSLYAKGSVALPASEKNQGDHVEAMDATNVYCLFDSLESQHSVDLRVAA